MQRLLIVITNMQYSAVTALYKGTPRKGTAVLLRSYDSRREPPPEFDCTVWQAGRATSATGLAFKPIQIGHITLRRRFLMRRW
jgi:glycine hydroxymethyltransferase